MNVKQSRKHFTVTLDVTKAILFPECRSFSTPGTKGAFDVIFPRKQFHSEAHVQKYVSSRLDCDFIQTKQFRGAVKKIAVEDSDMTSINALALKALTKDDVAVYVLECANTVVDRDEERFANNFLLSLVPTLKGKSFMQSHNRQMPIGRVFDTWSDARGDDLFLMAKVYVLKATFPEVVTNMDAGIWSFISISCTVPVYAPVADANGNILYYEFRNADKKKGEALEVSLVWLGAQYGASAVKDPGIEEIFEKIVLLSSEEFEACRTADDVREAVARRSATHALGSHRQSIHQTKKRSTTMKIFLKALGELFTFTPSTAASENDDLFATELQEALDAKLTAKVNELTTANTTQKTAFEGTIEVLKKTVDKYRASITDEAIGFMHEILKFKDDTDRNAEKAKLALLTVEQLEAERDRWKKTADEKRPAADSRTEGGADGSKVEPLRTSTVQSIAN